jgi:hypothetical protein
MKNLKAYESYKANTESNEGAVNEASTSSIMSDCYKKVLGEDAMSQEMADDREAAHEIFMAIKDQRSKMSDSVGPSDREKRIMKAMEGIKTQDQFKKTFELLQCMITTEAKDSSSFLPDWLRSKKNFLATPKETLDWLDKFMFTSFGVLPDYGEDEMRMKFKKISDKFPL